MIYYPQLNQNVRVADKDAVINDPVIKELMCSIKERLLPTERIILRKSGTEPLIRIMAECTDADKCRQCVSEVLECIRERGYELEG